MRHVTHIRRAFQGFYCNYFRTLAVGILFTIGLVGYSLNALAASNTTNWPDHITIGAILPLTGSTAQNGNNSLRGIKLAVSDINNSGGIKSMGGAKLNLITADATSDPAKAASAAINFLSRDSDPLAIIGAYASSLTETVARVTERAKIPLLSTSFADTLTEQGYKYFFQLPAAASLMGAAQLKYATEIAQDAGDKISNIAIVYANNAYGSSQAKSLKKQAIENGIDVTLFTGYSPTITNARPIAAKIRRTDADAIFSISYVSDGILLVRALKSSGSTLPIVGGTGGYVTADFGKALGSVANGIFSVTTSNPDVYGHIGEQYLNKYGAFMPQEGHDNAAAVYVIAEALEQHPTTDPTELTEYLHKGTFKKGAAGSMPGGVVEFDSNGVNVHARPIMVQWQNGNLVGVWPPDIVEAKPHWRTSN